MRYAKIRNVKKPSYLNSNYWHKYRITRKYRNKHAKYSIYTKEYLKKCSFCNGSAYALSLQSSSFFIIPNFGVRKNSFLFPKSASKTATVLLTDMPAE